MISRRLKKLKTDIEIRFRKIYAKYRTSPDFIIIGAQKAGTTSLYKYLIQHPQILPALIKEIHYFDINYFKGINWYRSFFPLKKTLKKDNLSRISGEASPQYMFHPHSLSRICSHFPEAKIIILLRNPISRTFSHYQHQVRVGREILSFEEAIDREEIRLGNELAKMSDDLNYNSYNLLMFSYLNRSIYYPQVKNAYNLFKSENILIIQSEKINENTQEEYNNIIKFLGLNYYKLDSDKKYNSHKYPPIKTETKQMLEEYFQPHNEKLFDLIGERFDW